MIEIRDLIGKPYKIHGRGPDSFDCYGLAIEVEKRMGKILPDYIYSEINQKFNKDLIDCTKPLINATRKETPEYSAVVVLRIRGYDCHIGVCLADGNFIHCTKTGVQVESLSTWSKRIEGYYTWP